MIAGPPCSRLPLSGRPPHTASSPRSGSPTSAICLGRNAGVSQHDHADGTGWSFCWFQPPLPLASACRAAGRTRTKYHPRPAGNRSAGSECNHTVQLPVLPALGRFPCPSSSSPAPEAQGWRGREHSLLPHNISGEATQPCPGLSRGFIPRMGAASLCFPRSPTACGVCPRAPQAFQLGGEGCKQG